MELLHQEGETIGQRYRIDGILGEGGSGTTYRSQDLQTGQPVALKALSLRHLSDWKMIELFEREAAVLAQLEHTAIPRYLEYFHVDTPTDRCFYIAQELAEGESLAVLVEKGWHATETSVRSIAIKILEILVYLHQFQPPVIHRDIKPQNIIRRDDSRVFLVDFGAVQQTYHSTLARGSTVVGTFGYMAPEQFTGKAVPATDLYGLGATLLFLLTHRSPAELPTDRLKIDFRSHVQISEEFACWLEKMLSPDVGERFTSASEALAVLQGKRKLKVKSRSAKQWKRFIKLGVAAVVAVGVVHYRYSIFGYFSAPNAFFEAARKGDVERVRYYLERGINANVMRQGEEVALHLAAANGNAEVAELLIAKGGDVNAKGKHGNTPLLYAASRGNWEVVELLLDLGADVNGKNDGGDTTLHHAARGGNLEIAELLLGLGADVNAKNSRDRTTLHHAARGGNLEIVELLLGLGLDVNAKDKYDKTTLHHAARGGNLEIVELLLGLGLDVNAKDKYGQTPLHEAVWGNTPLPHAVGGNLEVVELLLAKGADIDAKDNLRRTPLHNAANTSIHDYQ